MAKFLKGNQLNAEIENIFEYANSEIIIISPYIKFHSRIKEALLQIRKKPEVSLKVVFGKNENELSKSLSSEDFKFLSELPNIEIRHEARLHAKYYANEKYAILSSMNLYDFSQNNNIEFGILTQKANILHRVTGSVETFDDDASAYFRDVIENSELLFHKTPNFKEKNFGLSRAYDNSEIKIDKLTNLLLGRKEYTSESKNKSGFCIRTGQRIDFNPNKPLSDQAFQSWSKFSNPDYPEKFCHFSGEPSNGETTVSKPILKKNWKKAKEVFAFA